MSPSTGRSSSRSAARTAATAGTAAASSLVVDPQLHTLLDFHFRPHVKASNGTGGAGAQPGRRQRRATWCSRCRTARSCRPLDGEVLADLVGAGTDVRGGPGRPGRPGQRRRWPTARRKAPGFAELGEPGEQLDVVLELKSVADVGLVGFPSAGKSSLISVMSAAKPKIADYPFTTLVPNLGVVQAGDQTFTVADVPGPDPGRGHRQGAGPGVPAAHRAHRGAGARRSTRRRWRSSGTRSPTWTPSRPSWPRTAGWSDRPRIVVLNKIDIPDGRDLAEHRPPRPRGPRAAGCSRSAR